MTPERLAELRKRIIFATYHVPDYALAERAELREADAGEDMKELCDAIAARDDESRLLLVANDKLEIAASQLQTFVATGSPETYRRLAAIELEVRHAMAAVRDIAKGRGILE